MKVHELVVTDYEMTLKLLEGELHINWEMICQILRDQLEERKICMKFVPHRRRDEQKEHRIMARHHKQVVVFKEFVPEGKTLNSEFYVKVVERLLK
jgi:hypothetical protein